MKNALAISCFWFRDHGLVAIHAPSSGPNGIDILYRRSCKEACRALLIGADSERNVSIVRVPDAPPFELLIGPADGELEVHCFAANLESSIQFPRTTASARWGDGGIEVAQAGSARPWADVIAIRTVNVWTPARRRLVRHARREARVVFSINNAGRSDYAVLIEVEGSAAAAPLILMAHHCDTSGKVHPYVIHLESQQPFADTRRSSTGKVYARVTLSDVLSMDRVYLTAEPGVAIAAEITEGGQSSPLRVPGVKFLGHRFAPLTELPPGLSLWTGPSSFSVRYNESPADVQQRMWEMLPLLEAAEQAGFGGQHWTAAGLGDFMKVPMLGWLFLSALSRLPAEDVHVMLNARKVDDPSVFIQWAMMPEVFHMWPLHPIFRRLPSLEHAMTSISWDLKRAVDYLVGGQPDVAKLIDREGALAVPYVFRTALRGMLEMRHWRWIGWLFATRTSPVLAAERADAYGLVMEDILQRLPALFCPGTALRSAADDWILHRASVIASPVADPLAVTQLALRARDLLRRLDNEVAGFLHRRASMPTPMPDTGLAWVPGRPLESIRALLAVQQRCGAAATAAAAPDVQLLLEAHLIAKEARLAYEQDVRLGRLIGWFAAISRGSDIPVWPSASIAIDSLERTFEIVTQQLSACLRIGADHGPATLELLRSQPDGALLVDDWKRSLDQRLDVEIAGELAEFDANVIHRPDIYTRLRRLTDDLSRRRADFLGWRLGSLLRWLVQTRLQAERRLAETDQSRQAHLGMALDELQRAVSSDDVAVLLEAFQRLLSAIENYARRNAANRQAWQELVARLPTDLRASLALEGEEGWPADAAHAARIEIEIRRHAATWQGCQARVMAEAATMVKTVHMLQSIRRPVVVHANLASAAAGFTLPDHLPNPAIDWPKPFTDLSRLAAQVDWVKAAEKIVGAQYQDIMAVLGAERGLSAEPWIRGALMLTLPSLDAETAGIALPELVKLLAMRHELLSGGHPNVFDLSWLVADPGHRLVLQRAVAVASDFNLLLREPEMRAAALRTIAETRAIIREYGGRAELRRELTGRLVERFQAFRLCVRDVPPGLSHPLDVPRSTAGIWRWLLEVRSAARHGRSAVGGQDWTLADVEIVAGLLGWPELINAR